MKKIILLMVATLLCLGVAQANDKSKKKLALKTTCFSATIDCDHCVKKVMNTMPFEPGVKDVKVDLPKKQIEVTYDERKCSDEKVVKSLKRVDITAKPLLKSPKAKK